jgi:2-phosphoglycerate kinase
MPEAPALREFAEEWGHRAGLKPLFILIGGAAGSGKSSLASRLCHEIPTLTQITTSIIRTVLRATQPDTPWLAQHTYDLESTDDFLLQARPVMDCINQLARFAVTERVLYVIEGSTIVPGLFSPPQDVNPVELYLQVSYTDTHRRMLGGPTHDRSLTDLQFERCRKLQEFLAAEAERCGVPMVEYDQGWDCAVQLLERALTEA